VIYLRIARWVVPRASRWLRRRYRRQIGLGLGAGAAAVALGAAAYLARRDAPEG
jgi:hypothetical protein